MNPADQQSRRLIWELRGLWREWDPLGVYAGAGSDCPPDEYDNYLWPCLDQLQAHVAVADLASYLSYITGQYMGLGDTERVRSQAAGRWHAAKTRIAAAAQDPPPD